LKPAFEQVGATAVMVYLAVPAVAPGRVNAAAQGTSEGMRYLVETQQFDDENTGVNP
jgi:predicted component of type VI protein secretion system